MIQIPHRCRRHLSINYFNYVKMEYDGEKMKRTKFYEGKTIKRFENGFETDSSWIYFFQRNRNDFLLRMLWCTVCTCIYTPFQGCFIVTVYYNVACIYTCNTKKTIKMRQKSYKHVGHIIWYTHMSTCKSNTINIHSNRFETIASGKWKT